MPRVFQRGQAGDLDATYHFTFTGAEEIQATIAIRRRAVGVEDGHVGEADVAVTADSRAWVGFLAGELGILRALLTRRVRVRGRLRLLVAFGRCFPGS